MLNKKDKIKEESNEFLEILFEKVQTNRTQVFKEFSDRPATLHRVIYPFYILNHYYKNNLVTSYYQILVSNIIESQSLLAIGFYNSGMNILRSALESIMKLVYYETHPIEWTLHKEGEHNLTQQAYREFLYSHPIIKRIGIINKEDVEDNWKKLCAYVHNDIRALKNIQEIEDITSVYTFTEREYQAIIGLFKKNVKLIITILLVLDNTWLEGIDKYYYNLIIEIYTPEELEKLKSVLSI